MRNTTKLKHMLLLHTIELEMDEAGTFRLIMKNKDSGQIEIVEGKSYSIVLSKAYSIFLNKLKNSEKRNLHD
jgi:hypothetical protein